MPTSHPPTVLRTLLLLLCLGLAPMTLHAGKRVVRPGPDQANLLRPDAFRPYEQGFAREADTFVCENPRSNRRGVVQTVVLNQTTPLPIIATASSMAQGVSGGRDPDYSLYLDITCADGSNLWGQSAAFDTGTHDWQTRQVRVMPQKPIRQVSFYLLFRNHAGRAAFRDARLQQLQVPQGAAPFDGVAVVNAPGTTGFAVRDVAADSDFEPLTSGQALGLRLQTQSTRQGRATFHQGRLTDTTGKDRAITLIYTLHVDRKDWTWLAGPRQAEPITPARDYHALSAGRLSRYPLAAVSSGNDGHAILLDLARPAVFRVGFSAASDELYIAYDLALTPEKPSAEFRFCTAEFDGAWGFRSAVAAMYELFPDQFRCRTPRQGLWMPFHKISQVQGWEDFGFAFKEGNNETAWDDAHGIMTFRYTEPMTWWMSMPREMPRTLDAALAHAKDLAGKGNASAQALLVSGHHDAAGRFAARLLDTPWCNGAVWSMNSAPGIQGEVTDFRNKWNAGLKQRLYAPGSGPQLDGEYIDSSEGYVTDEYDYRREHFAAMTTPLTFSPETLRPAILRGLIAFEYARAIADDVHGMGKLMMANSTPHNLCWLAPLMDVLGTETDWNPGRRWQPMSDAELLYRRVLSGPKPYCFLMNTVFDEFPRELTEKYFKRCLAYGMFPGFFSADASTGHYFSRPELYDRDRPLFRKYVPLCRQVAEAGWQPVTLARSSDDRVHVERFGRKYLTVFNDSKEPRTATITLQGLQPDGLRELVGGRPVTWQGGTVTILLEAEDVAVLEIK